MSIMNALGLSNLRRVVSKAPTETADPAIDEWVRHCADQDLAARTVDGYRHGDWCSAGYTTCSHRNCSKKARPSTIHTDHDCCGRSAHHR